jgi:hypothetical protein
MADKMTWAGRAVSGLLAPLFLMGVVMSLTKNPQAVEGLAKYGWPESALLTIALLELGSLVVYLIPQTAALGAVLLTGYLGGAVATHLRAGESAVFPVVVGVLVWLGLWLREPRLRQLLPLRR